MTANSTNLEDAIADLSGSDITLVEPGGNHGDRLIYEGFGKMADTYDVSYRSINYIDRLQESLPAKVRKMIDIVTAEFGYHPMTLFDLGDPDAIYIHGGGNFGDFWGSSMSVFRNAINRYPETPIIVGPQTYWFTETDFGNIVSGTEQTIEMFCREEYSYRLLEKHDLPDNVSLNLSPDTALYLDREHLLQYVDKEYLNGVDEGYDLLSFRNDKEGIVPNSTVDRLNQQNERIIRQDISHKGLTNFREFISLAEFAETIYTDRLHVSILGTILGIPVEMYENRYYKNRGVYKYALSDAESICFNDAV